MMTRNDIDKKVTELAAEYLGKGMWISTTSMVGHQGEEGKLDVTDGKNVYRILLDRKCGYGEDPDGLVLTVRKYDEEESRFAMSSTMHTLWNNKGEVLYTEEYFEIGDRTKLYTTNKFFATHCRNLHWTRCANRRKSSGWQEYSLENPARLTTIMDIVRSRKGYSRVTPDRVSVQRFVGQGVRYRIIISGKKDILLRSM